MKDPALLETLHQTFEDVSLFDEWDQTERSHRELAHHGSYLHTFTGRIRSTTTSKASDMTIYVGDTRI